MYTIVGGLRYQRVIIKTLSPEHTTKQFHTNFSIRNWLEATTSAVIQATLKTNLGVTLMAREQGNYVTSRNAVSCHELKL